MNSKDQNTVTVMPGTANLCRRMARIKNVNEWKLRRQRSSPKLLSRWMKQQAENQQVGRFLTLLGVGRKS